METLTQTPEISSAPQTTEPASVLERRELRIASKLMERAGIEDPTELLDRVDRALAVSTQFNGHLFDSHYDRLQLVMWTVESLGVRVNPILSAAIAQIRKGGTNV